MPELKVLHQKFLVRALACYQSPAHVAQLMHDEFNLKVPTRQVSSYHPDLSDDVPARWVRYFRSEREKFLANSQDNGVSHDSFLLRVLQSQLDQETLKSQPDKSLIMQLVKLAAQIRGGVFGKPVEADPMTDYMAKLEVEIAKVYGPNAEKSPPKGVENGAPGGPT